MLSPAQRNQLRKRAALQAAVVAPAMSMAGATAYEQQLLQLNQDRLRLKQVQSEQGKAELKRLLIPPYQPYIEGVLSAGNGAQDDVLTTLMVWCIDAGEFADALTIGAYVLKHNLKMPDRFARTTGCLLAEEVANGALKVQKAGGDFPLYVLEQAQRITAEHDMPDEARAKLHLATGRSHLGAADSHIEANELQHVEGHLVAARESIARAIARAIDLHSNCGGKKDLERVDRLLKKHAESKPTDPGTGEPTEPVKPPSDQDESKPSKEGAPSTDTGSSEPPAN